MGASFKNLSSQDLCVDFKLFSQRTSYGAIIEKFIDDCEYRLSALFYFRYLIPRAFNRFFENFIAYLFAQL